ncbi:hypothetical protein BGZ60DRAFT_412520 [Tricladium varicosporioides]|nr:hypothetical protein BGZ60DRAFT_412520 [Hymenoscyphus varicosporioides]
MVSLKENYIAETSIIDAPPAYEEVHTTNNTTTTSHPLTSTPSPEYQQRLIPHPSTFKPIVIPQSSHSQPIRTAFFSPFPRAYSPALQTLDISQSDFLSFIDHLNEAFIAAPGFQIASHVTGAISSIPLPLAGLVGSILGAPVNGASNAVSFKNAKEFLAEANRNFFERRGVRVRVLKTEKMMACVGVGYHGAELRLPALTGEYELDDPRMRRVRALGDKVSPVTFSVSQEPMEMGRWKRWGLKEAQRQDDKMARRLEKERYRGERKEIRQAGRERGHHSDLGAAGKREHKIAQKMYWIVIERADGMPFDNDIESTEDGELSSGGSRKE